MHTVTNSTVCTPKYFKTLIYANWNEEKWSNQVNFTALFFSALNYSHFLGVWREIKRRNTHIFSNKMFYYTWNAAQICSMVHITVYHVQSDLFNCFAKYFKWFSFGVCPCTECKEFKKRLWWKQQQFNCHKSRHNVCNSTEQNMQNIFKCFNRRKSNQTMNSQTV